MLIRSWMFVPMRKFIISDALIETIFNVIDITKYDVMLHLSPSDAVSHDEIKNTDLKMSLDFYRNYIVSSFISFLLKIRNNLHTKGRSQFSCILI